MTTNPRQAVVTKPEPSSQKTKRAARSGNGIGEGSGSGAGPGGAGNVGGGPPPPAAPSPVSSGLVAFDGVRESDARRTLTPEEQKRAQLESKFHPSILAVIDRLKDPKAAAGADEAKFIRNGKAEVQIWLTEKSEETIAKLKELGFEVVLDPKTAKLVIGRIPIEKLAALAELKSVRYVGPRM